MRFAAIALLDYNMGGRAKGFIMRKIVRSSLTFGALFSIWLVAGCATPSTIETRKQERVSAYEALSPEMRGAVDTGNVTAGMNMDDVYIAWGNPDRVVSGGSEAGQSTTWIYTGSYFEPVYYAGYRWGGHTGYYTVFYTRAQVTFVNGLVTRWQTFSAPPH
jgi:hypothetical protein